MWDEFFCSSLFTSLLLPVELVRVVLVVELVGVVPVWVVLVVELEGALTMTVLRPVAEKMEKMQKF